MVRIKNSWDGRRRTKLEQRQTQPERRGLLFYTKGLLFYAKGLLFYARGLLFYRKGLLFYTKRLLSYILENVGFQLMVLTFQKRFIATDSLIKGKLYREKKEIHREDRDYKSLTRGTRLQISTSAYVIRLPNIPTSGWVISSQPYPHIPSKRLS